MDKYNFVKNLRCFTLVLAVTITFAACVKKIEVEKTVIDAVTVKGKVTHLDRVNILKDAYVYVYKDTSTDFKDNPFLISKPTDENGEYSITLPSGEYYLVARKFLDGISKSSGIKMQVGEYYSYYGGNPVAVYPGKPVFVGLNCTQITKEKVIEKSSETDKNGIKGTVTYNNEPVSDAYVFVFEKTDTNFRGPSFKMADPTDKSGNFILDLDPGAYYILAKKKKDINPDKFYSTQEGRGIPGGNIIAGPLAQNDYYYYYYDNPIIVAEGSYVDVNLPAMQKMEENDVANNNFSTPIRIEGTVRDLKDNPVSGIRVFALRRKMIGREKSVFISNLTKEDGEYAINFTESGLFFLVARDFIGRLAANGDTYGYYFGTEDHSIIIGKDHLLKDIDIKIWKIE